MVAFHVTDFEIQKLSLNYLNTRNVHRKYFSGRKFVYCVYK